MANVAEIPRAQPIFIGPTEVTSRNMTLQKVAIFSTLLGLGLLLASFYAAIPFWVGGGITVLSYYAFHYLANIDFNRGLIEAARDGNRLMLKFLLFLGANPNVQSNHPAISNAALYGHSEIIKDLIYAGADPNTTGGTPRVPLHYAVHATQDVAVAVLLIHGADPTIRTVDLNPNFTPLEDALRRQQNFLGGTDHFVHGDSRTPEERIAASNVIVELLRSRI